MSEHLYTYIDPPNEKDLARIVDVLRHDGVIAISAGTNWVFAADAESKRGQDRLVRLKPDRPDDQPFAILCTDISMVTSIARVDGAQYKLLKRIWPGPFTVLLKTGPELPRRLSSKRKVVGVRVPDDPLAAAIVDRLGGPLQISTVPHDDDGEPRTLGYQIDEVFGHAIDLVVDLGEPLPGTQTTVLDLTEGTVEVVRHGAGQL
jgi:tRNA threonylcarbamoyl adenosine modification protein (Sua5/YciO/YrdC/YwlC family)